MIVILMAVLIHGCQASAAKNSLIDYNTRVSQLMSASNQNGANVFRTLESGQTTGQISDALTKEWQTASQNLTSAEDLGAPGQMAGAQQHLETVMQLRSDGIHQIASNIQQALNRSTGKDGVYAISVGTSYLYASDVIYKGYVTRAITRALHGDGITVCPANAAGSCGDGSVSLNAGQILPNLGWLDYKTIATRIGASLPSSELNTDQPGLHGDALNFTSVNGTQLSTTASNTVSLTAGQAPSFDLNVTNGGAWPEYVTCNVDVKDSVGASSRPVRLNAGQTGTCTVALGKSPPTGTYTVTASVDKVPGETNTQNNQLTYTIQFS